MKGRNMSHGVSRIALGLCTLGIAIPLAACQSSSSPSSDTVSAQDLQTKVSDYLGEQKPESVSCPNDLKPEVGQSIECTVKVNDRASMQVAVIVAKVGDGGKDINYDYTRSYTKDQLATQVQDWAEQQKTPASSVTCDAGLQGAKGAQNTTYCNAVDPNGAPMRVLVTQTVSASGGNDLNISAVAPAAKGR